MSDISEDAEEQLSEKSETIDRLMRENAGLRRRLESLRTLISNEYPDISYASVRGSVVRLLKRVNQLEELLKQAGDGSVPPWS